MRCEKCGQENQDYARFCEKCGAPLREKRNTGNPRQSSSGSAVSITEKQGKTRWIVGAAFILIIAACIAGYLLYWNSQKEADYQGKLRTANKYLQALDYEKAEAAYLEAIEIQPRKEDAYIKLADIYTEQGEYEKAEEILESGEQQVSGDAARKKITDRIQGQSEVVVQYTSFYNLCRQYQQRYGQAGYEMESEGAETVRMTGLCIARLYDFDRDGRKELILAYPDQTEIGGEDYFGEVWAWQNGELKCVLEKTALAHDQDTGKWLEVTADDKASYFTLEGGGMYTEYFRYDGSGFKSVFRFEQGIDETGQSLSRLNGEPASSEEISAALQQLPKQNLEVDLYGGTIEYEPEGMDFRIDLQVLPEAYAKALAEDTNRTVERMAPKDSDSESGKQNKGTQYRAYYDLCMEYQQTYGEGACVKPEGADGTYGTGMRGLCAIKLFDFDKDGSEELLLGYATENEETGEIEYFNEVWSWNGTEAMNVLETTPVCTDQDGCAWIETAEKDGKNYLITIQQGGEFIQCLQYENGQFTSGYEYEMIYPESGGDFFFRINGTDYPSYEDAERELRNFPEMVEVHDINTPAVPDNNEGKFYICLKNISESYGESLQEYNRQTLETLADVK